MKEQPLVSVIVPVYKVEKYLEKCVETLRQQTLSDIEIILVDDGSPDGCPKMCDRFAEEDERIVVIHKENGGLSDARNAGIDASKGQFLLFVDGDDYAGKELAETLYALAIKHDADISAGGFYEVYENHTKSWKTGNEEFVYSGEEAYAELLKGSTISGYVWGKLYRSALFETVRFPKGINYEDLYISPELYLKAEKVAAVYTPLCFYRRRMGSLTTEKYSPKAMDAIKACTHIYKTVEKEAPKILPEAQFRLYWSYFHVLDRMLFEEDYKKIPEYKEVVGYLRKNWKKIATCPFFMRSRRVAAVALKAGIGCYRILWRMQIKRQGGFTA